MSATGASRSKKARNSSSLDLLFHNEHQDLESTQRHSFKSAGKPLEVYIVVHLYAYESAQHNREIKYMSGGLCCDYRSLCMLKKLRFADSSVVLQKQRKIWTASHNREEAGKRAKF